MGIKFKEMSGEIQALIVNNPKITISQMAIALKMTSETVEQYIAALKLSGQIKPIRMDIGLL